MEPMVVAMKRNFTILIVLGTVLIGVAIAVAISYYRSFNYILDQSNFTEDSLALVEKHTTLRLPAGSKGLNMVYRGFQVDPAFLAKIEIPEDAATILRSQIEKIKDEDSHPIDPLIDKTAWWKPVKSEIVIERRYTVGSSYANVIFCQENENFVLFVEWFSF